MANLKCAQLVTSLHTSCLDEFAMQDDATCSNVGEGANWEKSLVNQVLSKSDDESNEGDREDEVTNDEAGQEKIAAHGFATRSSKIG